MSNLLEHMPEPLSLLKECNRILKRNGRLIMTVPFLIKVHQAPYDFLRYTEYMLQRLFLEGGFENFRIEKIGNIFDVQTQISSSLYHFISTSSGSRYRFVRAIIALLYRLHYYSITSMVKISGINRRHIEDSIGYPHGYGCVAVR